MELARLVFILTFSKHIFKDSMLTIQQQIKINRTMVDTPG